MITKAKLVRLLDDALEFGELYHLISTGNSKQSAFTEKGTILLKYTGKVGNGNLYNFEAVPGGWTISLSPLQLVNRIALADDIGKQKEKFGKNANKHKKFKPMELF